jgi:hypothetical protein
VTLSIWYSLCLIGKCTRENTFSHLFDSCLTGRVHIFLLVEKKKTTTINKEKKKKASCTTQVFDAIMVIDRQTLVQIVLLFDIDHNDDGLHMRMNVSPEKKKKKKEKKKKC